MSRQENKRNWKRKGAWISDAKRFFCTVPEYWQWSPRERPRTYEGFMKKIQRKGGYWLVKQMNEITGECDLMMICENAITDNGAISMWKNTMNASAGGIGVANIMAINQGVGYTTLNGTISSGASPTSITVFSLTGPTIANGSTLLIGAGTANTYQCTLNQVGGITGAGTYTVTAGAGATGNISSGANIQVIVGTGDVSSLSAPVSYTAALPSGQFTISGTGVGNRQMSVNNGGNYLFSTSSNSNPATATAANYTDCWFVNTNPVAATTQTFIHVSFPAPVAVNASSNGQCTITEKI